MIRALHRAVLRTRTVPGLSALYRGGYAGAAALSARALYSLPGSSAVYLHRGLTRDGWEPGVSDIDLLLLRSESADAPEENARLARLSRRVAALRRPFPMLGDLWVGSEGEVLDYLRWGGLRAWEDPPDWKLMCGRRLAVPASEESALKRRWLDPWVWVFVSHAELSRRVLSPGRGLPEKDDADLRKLYWDARRYSDFILDGGRAGTAPRTRAAAKQEAPEAARLSPRAVA